MAELLLGELVTDAHVVHQFSPSPLVVVGLQLLDAPSNIDYDRVSLLIPHVALSDTPSSHVQRLYPKGALVSLPGLSAADLPDLIQAPQMIAELGLFPFLTIKGPSMLQVLSFFPPTDRPLYQSMDSSQLRKKGNDQFSEKNYDAAAEFYGMSIDKASADPDNNINVESLVLAHSNRALCFLRLGMWIEAYDDCFKALQLDPGHGKSAFRLGIALHHMQEYSAACDALERAPNYNVAITEALEKSRTFLAQSTSGQYGKYLEDFFMSASCEGNNAPECSEYLGPVEIRLTPDGKGRGLFATKDLKAGSLVLVSTAMAMARWQNSKDDAKSLEADAVTKLVQKCMRSKEHLQQLYTLPDSKESKRTDVPPMSLFGPNKAARAGGLHLLHQLHCTSGRDSLLLEVDAERIGRIFRTTAYAYNVELLVSSSVRHLQHPDLFSGLWLLPGFINHSCFSNLSTLEVGDAAFLHATRDIKAGDELTVCYIDVHMPWASYRRERCLDYGFECKCRRCAVEAAYEEKLQHISSVYCREEIIYKEADPDVQRIMAALAPQIEVVIQDASDEEKYIIRTSYIAAYVSYYMERAAGNPVGQLDDTGLVPPPTSLACALRFCVPGHYKTVGRLSDLSLLEMSDFWSWTGYECGRKHHVIEELLRRMKVGTWPWQRRMEKRFLGS